MKKLIALILLSGFMVGTTYATGKKKKKTVKKIEKIIPKNVLEILYEPLNRSIECPPHCGWSPFKWYTARR